MRIKTLIPALVLAFGASACGGFFHTAAAVVNGHPITFDDLQERVASTLKQNPNIGASSPDARANVERAVLGELIRRELLREEAADLGLKVSEADVAKRLADLRVQYPDLDAQIAQAGISKQQVHDDIRDQLVLEKLTARRSSVTEAQVADEYKKNINSYRQIKAKHILIATATRSDAAALKRAKDALARINAGESFAAVAKEMSDDPGSAQQGGELGQLIPLTQLDPAFGSAAFAAPIGKVIGPVKSSYGYHLIVTEEKQTQPLAAVAASIRTQLEQNVAQSVAQEISDRRITKARIVVNPRFGDWDPKTQEIAPHQFFEPPTTDSNLPGTENAPIPIPTG